MPYKSTKETKVKTVKSDRKKKGISKMLHEQGNKKNGKQMMIINNNIVWRGNTYNPQYPKMLIKHFDSFQPYTQELNKINGKIEKIANDYPTFESFRIKHQITPSLRRHWVDTYPELKEAVEMAWEYKRHFLIQNGLHGTYNAQMAKFIGMNDLGMTEKKEVGNRTEIPEKSMKKMVREYLETIKDGGPIEILESNVIDEGNKEGEVKTQEA